MKTTSVLQGFTYGWVSGADGFSSDWSEVAAVLVVGLSGRANGMMGQALETGYGCIRGAKLWRANPMSGSGMK